MATRSASVPAPIEREGSATKQLKRFLSRYFYFCMTLLMAGLAIGCLNAWHWVANEDKAMHEEQDGDNK